MDDRAPPREVEAAQLIANGLADIHTKKGIGQAEGAPIVAGGAIAMSDPAEVGCLSASSSGRTEITIQAAG
ncbi:MAG TPA: hypothetical protein VHK65_06280 [Candidatus Dormibacteraeota bacterium]|nr:hypothetical protein [Candidatus Dormibacteraeota bacterium]